MAAEDIFDARTDEQKRIDAKRERQAREAAMPRCTSPYCKGALSTSRIERGIDKCSMCLSDDEIECGEELDSIERLIDGGDLQLALREMVSYMRKHTGEK